MGSSSTSAPKPTPLGTQFESLASGISQSAQTLRTNDAVSDPIYSQITSGAQQNAATGWGNYQTGTGVASSNAATYQLENDANKYTQAYAPQIEQTYLNNNPAMQGALQGSTAMSQGTSASMMSLMGAGNSLTPTIQGLQQEGTQLQKQSPLLQQQNLQAQQELATNGQLSNQEMSAVQQQTAGQFSSTGLGGSSANIADQALSLQQAQNSRLQQYQANASNVQSENTANANAATSAFGAAASASGQQGQIFGQATLSQNQANQNLFSLAGLMQSPIQNMQSSYLTAMNNYGTQAMTAGMQAPMSSQQLNPQEIQTMADYYNTQYNAQAAAGVANAQGSSATTGAEISGGSSLAAAGISAGILGSLAFCWVAREVLGTDNLLWFRFRDWMLHRAPEVFRNTYLKRGERFARAIRRKPRLKAAIRDWMLDIIDLDLA